MKLHSMEFKDFITLQRGFDLPKSEMKDGPIPVLSSNCVIGYHNEAKVNAPGVVTGRSGTLGVVQYTDEPFWPHNTALWVKDFKGNIPKYVFYKLQTLNLASFNGGASVPTLNRNSLDNLLVSVPDTKAQGQIADTLSAYDGLIENNRRRITLMEESARLIYQEWFVRLRFPGHERVKVSNGIPEGWKAETLIGICDEIREIVLPEELEPDTPYIGLEHMPRRSISLSDWGKAETVTSSKHKYLKGDIIFGKIRPYFHKVGIAFTDGVASSDAIVIRPKSDDLSALVLMTVSSDRFVAVASQTMKEGSKMPRADWKHMATYRVSVPPPGLLADFNETITTITDQLCNLCFQNQKLKTARDILLPRLMSGEIAA